MSSGKSFVRSEYEIVIDCPPFGSMRPGNVLERIIQDTELSLDDFETDGSITFGEQHWNIKESSLETYMKYKDHIISQLKSLYRSGVIRYAEYYQG